MCKHSGFKPDIFFRFYFLSEVDINWSPAYTMVSV